MILGVPVRVVPGERFSYAPALDLTATVNLIVQRLPFLPLVRLIALREQGDHTAAALRAAGAIPDT